MNDTATTEICTLSLHDALPIYLPRLVRRCGLAVEEVGEGDGLLDQLGVGLRPLVAADAEVVDRQSTRLNSSHANISYAVFCLQQNQIDVVLAGTTLNSSHANNM